MATSALFFARTPLGISSVLDEVSSVHHEYLFAEYNFLRLELSGISTGFSIVVGGKFFLAEVRVLV